MSMPETLRPRELALLLLGADSPPRKRARDQQADMMGLELKRRLLERLAALDPAPEAIEESLLQIVEQLGTASGPGRAVALSIMEEWQAARISPQWIAHLRAEAARRASGETGP